MTRFKETGSTYLPGYYGVLDKHFDSVKSLLIKAGVKFTTVEPEQPYWPIGYSGKKGITSPFLEVQVSWKNVEGARVVSKIVDILLRRVFTGGWPQELRKDWYKYLHR